MRFHYIAALLLALPAWGQTGRLAGTLSDSQKERVPGATVTIVATAGGAQTAAKTGADGSFAFDTVAAGTYQLNVTADGGRKLTVDKVEVASGQTRSVDLVLPPAKTANAPKPADDNVITMAPISLDQASAQVSLAIQPYQVQNVPINGRAWSSLMILSPGAVNSGDGTQQSIRYFGHSRDDNNWTLDGMDATGIVDQRQRAGLRAVIPIDAISEFRVNSAQLTAENTNTSAAQVNLTSRAGSNDWHGSVFEFLQNSELNARNPRETSVAPFRLNQFGANAGGRIRQDRTFVFGAYEGLRQSLAEENSATVPTPQFRALAAAPVDSLIKAFPAGQTVLTDRTARLTRMDSNLRREDSGLIRVDHQFNEKHNMFVRYNTDDGYIHGPNNALLEHSFTDVRPTNGVVRLLSLFSGDLVNEVKAGVNRYTMTTGVLSPLPLGISISGLTRLNGNTWNAEAGTSYSLVDNLLINRGRHTIKSGLEVRRVHMNSGASGTLTVSYSSLDTFLANRVSSMSGTAPLGTRGVRRTFYMGYLQDEFRLRENLTFNLGLRYESYGVASEVNGFGRVFDPASCAGWCAPGTPFHKPDRNNFDPRVSIGWAPKAFGGKTVIRTGYGIYHSTGRNGDVDQPISNDSLSASVSSTTVPGLKYPVEISILQAVASTTPFYQDPNRRDAYTQQWSLSVQQQLPGDFIGQAAYVGSNAHKLYSRSYINLIDPATGKRRLPQFGRVDDRSNQGNSNYNGLMLSLQRALTKGWMWGSDYMWSHSIDDTSIGSGEANTPQNVSCRSCERASGSYDLRHTIVVNSTYRLPFGPGTRLWNVSGWRGALIGGWTISGLASARTGQPLNVTMTRSASQLPDGNTSNQRPDLVPGVSLIPSGGQTPNNWLNRAAFATPAAGTWGNAGRNIVRGPGAFQADLALAKRFTVREGTSLDFRAEAFNVTNHPQWGNPSTSWSSTSTSFGRVSSVLNSDITGMGRARQLQFMLRLSF